MSIPGVIRRRAQDLLFYPAPGGKSYDETGEHIPQPTIPGTIKAHIQPITGRELQMLEEGLRDEAQYTGWVLSAIRTDDRLEWSGSTLKVIQVREWDDTGQYWRVILGEI